MEIEECAKMASLCSAGHICYMLGNLYCISYYGGVLVTKICCHSKHFISFSVSLISRCSGYVKL